VILSPLQLHLRFRVAILGVGLGAGLSVVAHGAQSSGGAGNGTGRAAQGFLDPSRATSAPELGPATPDSLPVFIVPYQPPPSAATERLEFEREQTIEDWTDQDHEPQPIYFPPAPPVLGAPLSGLGLYSDDVMRELAPFVCEPFYAPLSTRLSEEDLGRRLRTKLEAYRDEKAALLAELRTQLEALRMAAADERRHALAELADRQDPALAALEEAADELRREFYRTRFLGGGGDWNQFRAWRLSPDDRARDKVELRRRELRVLRAAIYYQEGMSAAQRRLLREVVMDQAAMLHAPGAGLGLPPDDSSRVIFFSPEMARLPLPAQLPADLEAMIVDYTARKDALKEELRDRLVRFDADRNATRRARAVEDLAGEQTVRLADLDELADRIREHLSPLLQAQDPGAPPALPGALEGRVAAYLRDKNELQRVAQERLAIALTAFDDAEQNSKAARKPERRAALVRSTVDAFHADHADQIAALNAEAEAIRGELVRHAATKSGANADKSVDALLRDFAEAFKRQQLAACYAEYRTAVLEPGLSPAQRRLLFDAAIVDLKLPGAVRDRQVSANETLSSLRP
jgi:hypothetical protein